MDVLPPICTRGDNKSWSEAPSHLQPWHNHPTWEGDPFFSSIRGVLYKQPPICTIGDNKA